MTGWRPVVALTMGDVAGIGPQVIARAWADPALHSCSRPFVIGRGTILRRALACNGQAGIDVVRVEGPGEVDATLERIPCLEASSVPLDAVPPGQIDARAGAAARDFLVRGIDLALAGRIDAITTLPLNKESLRAAGVPHPGHTEILAERCGVADFSMMLYLAPGTVPNPAGLGIVHATLHIPLREVFDRLTRDVVFRAIALADRAMRPMTAGRGPRIAVAGLNPHAGEHGLFGVEEATIIGPAVERARDAGLDVDGPIAADTLFTRALRGEFDAVVAMYHDQGHVAVKTVAFDRAVNVTLGLPIVRTSVAHGTAFDIAWKGLASSESLIESVRVAARFAATRRLSRDAGAAPPASP